MPYSSPRFSLYSVGILDVCCVTINNLYSWYCLHGVAVGLPKVSLWLCIFISFFYMDKYKIYAVYTNKLFFFFKRSFIFGLKLSWSKQCLFIFDMQGNVLGNNSTFKRLVIIKDKNDDTIQCWHTTFKIFHFPPRLM